MKIRYSVSAAAIAAALAATMQPLRAQSDADPLLAGFRAPPQEARPRVWWHWMNGNVTEDGIAKDLAWMRRVGIGGVQNFDASLVTPQVVGKRLGYMTADWRSAFRFAAARAAAEGLELAIAGSPGWSETGGPWVPPEDGIKKISWSETLVNGGRRFSGRLTQTPVATGAYQTMGAESLPELGQGGHPAPSLYRDIAVFAVPLTDGEGEDAASFSGSDGRLVDAALLSDGKYDETIDLGMGTADAAPMLNIRYARPRQIRSATLFMRDALPNFFDPRFTPVIEARVDGQWRAIGKFQISAVPTTIAFAPTKASEFRVVFSPFRGSARPFQRPVPGAIVPSIFSPPTGPGRVKLAEFTLTDEARVDGAEAKAGFSVVNDYNALTTSASSEERGVPITQMLNLTDRLRADGTLDWTPPKGKWRVLRIGWTLTGKKNHPASPEATGLEVDKLDGAAVERYLRHYLATYKDALGSDLSATPGVRALMIDSTEVGAFNWTPRMIEQFRKLRGYDPTPWLPTLTGQLVGSRADSDRFLYDFRRTLSELHATEHYATIARIAHDHGMIVYGEALEDQRPVLGDDMAMRRFADIPMGALWTWANEFAPRPTLLGDMKGASSVGHLYGKNIVAAESMTSALAPWANAPADLRKTIDLEFVHGINRPVIHTSVHQPIEKAPGLSLMVFGQFFNRHESWAEMARPWVDYMSRSAFLLQQGRNLADVAYFYGEEAPITALTAFGQPDDLPRRYAYDYVNADALRDVLRVENGDLVSKAGSRYRVLYLGANARSMTLATLRRIAALAQDGATIVGEAPLSTLSLIDDGTEFAALTKRLWSGDNVTLVGKGKVIATRKVESALAMAGVAPDLNLADAAALDDVMFVHRRLNDGDLYFLVNRGKRALQLDASFRTTGKAPEIWRADSGAVTAVSYRQEGGATHVPLEFDPEESLFLMFRKDAAQPVLTVAKRNMEAALNLEGGWTVSFEKNRGAPLSTALPTLRSLSEHDNPAIRFFSGEATYSRTFTLPRQVRSGTKLWLDLGKVGDLAEVKVNGQSVGSAWHAPYRVYVGDQLLPGKNSIEVKVANLWVNRLIGDAQPDATKVAFTTIPTFRPDAPLRPSGLIGPVSLLIER